MSRFNLPELAATLPESMTPTEEAELLGFYRATHTAECAQQVLTARTANIRLPVRSGRSTVLSSLLARESRRLVYHVLANPILTAEVHAYVSRVAYSNRDIFPSVTAMYYEGGNQSTSGVVYVSAAVFLAEVTRTGGECLKGAVVMVDEIGRSDQGTRAAIEVAKSGSTTGVYTVVGDDVYQHGSGNVYPAQPLNEPVGYTDRPMAKWSPIDRYSSWSVDASKGHSLFLTDSDKDANNLVASYGTSSAWLTYRLDERSTRDQLKEVSQALHRDDNRVLVVATSAYRSGLNFPVTQVFDSGAVAASKNLFGKVPMRQVTDVEMALAATNIAADAVVPPRYWAQGPTGERAEQGKWLNKPFPPTATIASLLDIRPYDYRRISWPIWDGYGRSSPGPADLMQWYTDYWYWNRGTEGNPQIGVSKFFRRPASSAERDKEVARVFDAGKQFLADSSSHRFFRASVAVDRLLDVVRTMFVHGGGYVSDNFLCYVDREPNIPLVLSEGQRTIVRVRELAGAADVGRVVWALSSEDLDVLVTQLAVLYSACVSELSSLHDALEAYKLSSGNVTGVWRDVRYAHQLCRRAVSLYESMLNAAMVLPSVSLRTKRLYRFLSRSTPVGEARVLAYIKDFQAATCNGS